jgi:uncharacterized protein (TIGR02246 family)
MKSLALLCVTAAMAFAMTACNQAPAPAGAAPDTHDADVKAITDNETQWNGDWAAKDSDKILAHYSDDAVLMAPGMEPLKGRDAIKGGLGGMLADKALSLKFKASNVEVSKSGDLGYTRGDYQMTMTDPATHKVMNDHGTYVTTYHKQADGSWKAVADIASSSVPLGGPPKHKGM